MTTGKQQLDAIHDELVQDCNRTPNCDRRYAVTLRSAASVFDAGRYDDAMGILDWLWSSDNVHAFARVAGLRAMSVVYRAKGDNDAAENCERWAQTLAPRKQQ